MKKTIERTYKEKKKIAISLWRRIHQFPNQKIFITSEVIDHPAYMDKIRSWEVRAATDPYITFGWQESTDEPAYCKVCVATLEGSCSACDFEERRTGRTESELMAWSFFNKIHEFDELEVKNIINYKPIEDYEESVRVWTCKSKKQPLRNFSWHEQRRTDIRYGNVEFNNFKASLSSRT